MSYRIIPDQAVLEQVAALPADALVAFSEVLAVLEITPWNGEPQHADNPDGPVRRWPFGPDLAGQVVYLVMDDDRQEVHLLLVQRLG